MYAALSGPDGSDVDPPRSSSLSPASSHDLHRLQSYKNGGKEGGLGSVSAAEVSQRPLGPGRGGGGAQHIMPQSENNTVRVIVEVHMFGAKFGGGGWGVAGHWCRPPLIEFSFGGNWSWQPNARLTWATKSGRRLGRRWEGGPSPAPQPFGRTKPDPRHPRPRARPQRTPPTQTHDACGSENCGTNTEKKALRAQGGGGGGR